jgi:hypothetical protein
VIEWPPNASEVVAKAADPELNVPVPNTVAPSLKVTVPPAGPPAAATVAVKVTEP